MHISIHKRNILTLSILAVVLVVLAILITRLEYNTTIQKKQSSSSREGVKSGQGSSTNEGSANNLNPEVSSEQQDLYANWNQYKNPTIGYRIKYPQNWSKIRETTQSAHVTFAPKEKTDAVTSISFIESDTPPSKLLDLGKKTIFSSDQTPINSLQTYDVRFGDATYVNHCYLIAHEGGIIEICMTETAKTPLIDNLKYVDQFNLIAQSLEF